MDLLDLVAGVWSRGGELRAVNGRVRYCGPRLAPNDPIRAAIAEHRAALLALAEEYERRQEAWNTAEATA